MTAQFFEKESCLISIIFFLGIWILFPSSLAAHEALPAHESVRMQALQEQQLHFDSPHDYSISHEKMYCKPWPLAASLAPMRTYPTHSFPEIKNVLGQKNLKMALSSFAKRGADLKPATFSNRNIPIASYPATEKKEEQLPACQFSERIAPLQPKAQGGLDHDVFLQQALKKNLSVEEVRALLNEKI